MKLRIFLFSFILMAMVSCSGKIDVDFFRNGVVSEVQGGPKLAFDNDIVNLKSFEAINSLSINLVNSEGYFLSNADDLVTLSIETDPSSRKAVFINNGLSSISVNAVGGVADFSGVAIDSPGVGFVLKATASGFKGQLSNDFDILGASRNYRSIGYGTVAPVEFSGGNQLSILEKRAVFSSSISDNVGVGDVIQYDSDGAGDGSGADSLDNVVIITRRLSATEFLVHRPDHGPPIETSSDQDWSICRAYTSFNNIQSMNENTACLDDNLGALENFDTDTGSRNLVSYNEQWHLALYAENSVAVGSSDFSGWVTGSENFVRFFAPNESYEVGLSQRHEGLWDSTKSRMVVNEYYGAFNNMKLHYFRIDGLQMENTRASITNVGGLIRCCGGAVGNGEIHFVNNILKKDVLNDLSTARAIEISGDSTDKKIVVANNIIYGFKTAIYKSSTTPNAEIIIQNNTIGNSSNVGIYLSRYGIGSRYIVRNNIFSNSSGVGADWLFSPGDMGVGGSDIYDSNHSTDGTAIGTNTLTGQIGFLSEIGYDYRLYSTDTLAFNTGLDLTNDPDYAIKEDVKGLSINSDFHRGAHGLYDYWTGNSAWNDFGEGTAEKPYGIFNEDQFFDIGNSACSNGVSIGCNSYFRLYGDIDLGSASYTPIGNSANPFSGTLEGNDKTISNLVLSGGSEKGVIGTSCNVTVKNLTISGITYTGSSNFIGGIIGRANCATTIDDSHVLSGSIPIVNSNNRGGLVGGISGTSFLIKNSSSNIDVGCFWNCGGIVGGISSVDGTILNSYSTGNISHSPLANANSLGGLVGNISGATNTINIIDTYSLGEVAGKGDNVGGLIGSFGGLGTITNSYSTGKVTNTAYNRTGGLIGYMAGSANIDSSYSISEVRSSGTRVGGLIGEADTLGTISNSWAAGDIYGSSNIGGLVGNLIDGAMTYSHSHGDVRSSSSIAGGAIGNQDGGANGASWNFATGDVYSESGSTGGYVGRQDNGCSDCYATGNVYSKGSAVGGFAGRVHSGARRSFATGNVYGVNAVGGFSGSSGNPNAHRIDYVYSTGDVHGLNNVGGLVGLLGRVRYSYSLGSVFGNTNVAGLIAYPYWNSTTESYTRSKVYATTSGYAFAGTFNVGEASFSNNYWDNDVESSNGSSTNTSVAGRYEPRTTAQLKSKSSPLPGFDMANRWTMVDGITFPIHRWDTRAKCMLNETVVTYNGIGAGVLGDPYILCNRQQLTDFASNGCGAGNYSDCDKVFYIGRDIDLKSTSPGLIGSYPDNCFSGVFDGHNKKILNYSHSSSSTHQGFFSCISGRVRNLNFKNVIFSGNSNSGVISGVLSGGVLLNSSVEGVVTGSGSSIGGIVGYLTSGSIIYGSLFEGEVSGVVGVGGIAGQSETNSFIKKGKTFSLTLAGNRVGGVLGLGSEAGKGGVFQAETFGDIIAPSGYLSGGILGRYGKIYDSFSAMDINSGGNNVGGLSGDRVNVYNSYGQSNSIQGASTVGGLMGSYGVAVNSYSIANNLIETAGPGPAGILSTGNSSSSSNSYWSSTASGITSGANAGSVDPLTTVEMNEQANFNTWDFINTWFIGEGVRPPMLRWQYHPICYDGINSQSVSFNDIGSGTAEDPYKLCFKEQLIDLAANCGSGQGSSCGYYYLLMNDIDLNKDVSMTSIGDSSSEFTGVFNGQNYSIYQLKLNNPGLDRQGLFGSMLGAAVVNLKVIDVDIAGNSYNGALAGVVNRTYINNILITGNISGVGSSTGGLIGAASISNGESMTISNSRSFVNVVSGGSGGGLIASAYSTSGSTMLIDNCHYDGNVTGVNSVGGLVGALRARLINSSSKGTVSGNWKVGGLVGYIEFAEGSIDHSFSSADVNGGNDVGGLIGSIALGSVLNSYATGNVLSSGTRVGGFVGRVFDASAISIVNNYSSGTVTASSNKGGFAGFVAGADPVMTNNYWDETSSGETSGAVSGKYENLDSAQMQNAINFTGWGFAEIWKMIPGEPGPTHRK